jgi:hypothetical protein
MESAVCVVEKFLTEVNLSNSHIVRVQPVYHGIDETMAHLHRDAHTCEKQILSAKGFKRVRKHSEYAI